MYYRARDRAINNGRTYHLAAILKRRGRVIRVGENTNKTHPRFVRQHPDGSWSCHMHAEMNVLRFAQPGDEIEVMRFKKADHSWTMAKPCSYCMKFLKLSGIKVVKYTNWQGEWETLHIV